MIKVTDKENLVMDICKTGSVINFFRLAGKQELKHYLKIWALLMLLIHLLTLAAINFLPAEGGGMAFKKVCLRQAMKAKVAAATADTTPVKKLIYQDNEAETPETESEIRFCSVQLLCTGALYTLAFAPPLFLNQEPPFYHHDYFSVTGNTDPDPPQLG